jgi:transcriptional regulator with XRE-family HTH domain
MGEEIEASVREPRASPIDAHVGLRIRLRRNLLNMSQERLAESLGVTFQQVQKYERGVNRVGASRLWDLARVLDVPIAFFYDDMPDALSGIAGGDGRARAGARRGFGLADTQEPFGQDDPAMRRDCAELLRIFQRITDPAARRSVIDLLKNMAPRSGE